MIRLSIQCAIVAISVFMTLTNCQATQSDKCTDLSSTSFDGYLDKNIFYANFDWDQQSYIRIPNPLIANSVESSVSVWFRLSQLSDNGVYARSTIFECADSILARINGTKITMAITTKTDSTSNSKLDKTEVDIDVASDIEQLLEWNNYAFSFKNSIMFIHFNGN